MAHYAFIDKDNIVVEVITGKDEADTETLPKNFESWEQYYQTQRDGLICKRTSYNTLNGEHLLDGTPFRGNYAGIGYIYDVDTDIFLPPKPYPSWVLYADSPWIWKAPTPMPDDGNMYMWNEDTQSWDLIVE